MTDEQIRKVYDDSEKRFGNIMEAIAIIKKLSTDSGKIKCPACGNDLSYIRAKSNGYVWGKCKTENCLSWLM